MIHDGGRIYTGDPALPHVHALPIDDRGRVSRGVEAWEGDSSAVSNERIDLAGRTVVPGFRSAGGAFTHEALRDAPADRHPADILAAAQRAAHTVGLVAIHDTSTGPDALRLWQTLDRDERATLRVTVALDANRAPAAATLGLRSGFGSDRVRIGPAVLDPLMEDAAGIARELRAHDLDIALLAEDAAAMHAIPDCLPDAPVGATLTRIHVRAIEPPPGLAEIAIIAGDPTASTVLSNAIGRRVPLAVEAIVNGMTPLTWIAALRHAGADASTALRAVSATPALLDGATGRAGSLAPGAPADLVVLDGDPLEVPPAEVAALTVVATMVAGRWVCGRPPW